MRGVGTCIFTRPRTPTSCASPHHRRTPATHSGSGRAVKARRIRNKRLADACHWWAFASLTSSPGARAYYDHRRALGDRHNAALRNLANKLLGRLWWCLQNGQLWDDHTAWPTPSLQAAA